MLVLSTFGIRGMYLTNKENESIGEQWLPQRAHIDSANFFVQRTIGLENMYLLADKKERESIAKDIQWTHDGLHKDLEELSKLITFGEPLEKLKTVESNVEIYLDNQTKALAAADNNQLAEAKAILKQNKEAYKSMDEGLYFLVNHNQEKSTESNKNSNAAYKSGVTKMVVLIAISLIISLAGAYYLTRVIVKPIRKLNIVAQDVAEGNLVQENNTNSKDEIGELSESLHSMSNQLRSLILNINAEAAEILTFAREFTDTSKKSADSSTQISTTIGELAVGAEQQASHANSLSENIKQFSASAEQASTNSNDLRTEALDIASVTEKGYLQMQGTEEQMLDIFNIVQESVGKMTELDRNYKEVSKLVLTIQTISEQTNLLALNAAIEAARAGEHGKGFAVVADEVRKLSEQVADSVVEINQITNLVQQESKEVTSSLEDSYKKVELGSTKIKETSGTFSEISHTIDDFQKKITQMSNEISNISTGASEVQKSIEDIAAISEQSSAGIEETAAITEEAAEAMNHTAHRANDLVELSERLQQSSAKFNV